MHLHLKVVSSVISLDFSDPKYKIKTSNLNTTVKKYFVNHPFKYIVHRPQPLRWAAYLKYPFIKRWKSFDLAK